MGVSWGFDGCAMGVWRVCHGGLDGCAMGSLMGVIWVLMGVIWGLMGVPWGSMGVIWGLMGAPWGLMVVPWVGEGWVMGVWWVGDGSVMHGCIMCVKCLTVTSLLNSWCNFVKISSKIFVDCCCKILYGQNFVKHLPSFW